MSFPGMIHFLFIDRSFDELTSPSLAADEQVVCMLFFLFVCLFIFHMESLAIGNLLCPKHCKTLE